MATWLVEEPLEEDDGGAAGDLADAEGKGDATLEHALEESSSPGVSVEESGEEGDASLTALTSRWPGCSLRC